MTTIVSLPRSGPSSVYAPCYVSQRPERARTRRRGTLPFSRSGPGPSAHLSAPATDKTAARSPRLLANRAEVPKLLEPALGGAGVLDAEQQHPYDGADRTKSVGGVLDNAPVEKLLTQPECQEEYSATKGA